MSSLNTYRENLPENSPSPARLTLVVECPDGTLHELAQGEFRSGAGRLLFIRRGDGIEIRCPRSKELFRITFSPGPPTRAG
ncbi:MAG: hypothetical protein R3F13_07870 [Prosthecobacter sp.]